jgi:hypothetical protein
MFRSYRQSGESPRESTFLQSPRGGCSRQGSYRLHIVSGGLERHRIRYIELRNLIVKQLLRLIGVQSGIGEPARNVN